MLAASVADAVEERPVGPIPPVFGSRDEIGDWPVFGGQGGFLELLAKPAIEPGAVGEPLQARAKAPFLEGGELRCARQTVSEVAATGRPALRRIQGFQIGAYPGTRREHESAVVKVAKAGAPGGHFGAGQISMGPGPLGSGDGRDQVHYFPVVQVPYIVTAIHELCAD